VFLCARESSPDCTPYSAPGAFFTVLGVLIADEIDELARR
jgi:hypothetical protein